MPDWPYIAMFAPWLPVVVGVWWERRRESRQREAVSSQPPDGLLLKGKGRYKIVTDDDIDELNVNLPDGAEATVECGGTITNLIVRNGTMNFVNAGESIVTAPHVFGGGGLLDVTTIGDAEPKYIPERPMPLEFYRAGILTANEAREQLGIKFLHD